MKYLLPCLVLVGCSAATDVAESKQALCDNDRSECECPGSPIVIDIAGDGIHLTAWNDGVVFGLRPGTTGTLSWTAPGSDDAWLVLDRNRNGTIDNGLEMFGNFTEQAPPAAGEKKNGFRALARLDQNGDGVVNALDPAFSDLRLWQDKNHDAVSQPEELFTLPALGVEGVSVAYTPNNAADPFGNQFRYQAVVYTAPGARVGMTAWDVWLTGTKPVRVGDGSGNGSFWWCGAECMLKKKDPADPIPCFPIYSDSPGPTEHSACFNAQLIANQRRPAECELDYVNYRYPCGCNADHNSNDRPYDYCTPPDYNDLCA